MRAVFRHAYKFKIDLRLFSCGRELKRFAVLSWNVQVSVISSNFGTSSDLSLYAKFMRFLDSKVFNLWKFNWICLVGVNNSLSQSWTWLVTQRFTSRKSCVTVQKTTAEQNLLVHKDVISSAIFCDLAQCVETLTPQVPGKKTTTTTQKMMTCSLRLMNRKIFAVVNVKTDN